MIEVSRAVTEVLQSEALVAGAHGPAEIADVLPLGATALALAPERWRAPWLDLGERRALVRARVPDAGSAALLPVFDRIARVARRALSARLCARGSSGLTSPITKRSPT